MRGSCNPFDMKAEGRWQVGTSRRKARRMGEGKGRGMKKSKYNDTCMRMPQ